MHLNSANSSGTGSTNVIFTFDTNPGATRVGTLTIAEQTLTVTQAGSTFSPTTLITNIVASGLSSPTSLVTDNAGNVYIADRNSSSIKKWTAADNTVTTLVASGLSLPNAVAVDALGDLYIADSGNDAIKKFTITNSTLTTLVAGLNNPYGIAVDVDGNVFIADSDNNAIKKWFAADSNVVTLISSGLLRPIGLATDIAGNLYIADTFNHAIKKWTAVNSNVTTLVSSGLDRPTGVAVDGAGNVYIANAFDDNILKRRAANGIVTTIVSTGLLQPNGVAVDSAGNVFIANTGNNNIRELPRAFVDTAPRLVSAVAGSDALTVALPTTVNLLPPFAPASNQPWLTISNTSNGVITVAFTNNFGASRAANLSVLGLIVPITQSGPTFTLATNAASVGPAAGGDSVGLVTTPEGAPWTATNNVTWLHLANGFTSGTGSTNVSFTYDANPGAARIGTLTIAGRTFTVTQAELPLPEISIQQPAGTNLTDGNTTNDFGNSYTTFTNLTKTFTITNSGTANLTGLAITKDGANPGDFFVSAPSSATLAPNASATFTVSFAPATVGSRTANIHIASNDSDENPFDITLTGIGIAPIFSLATETKSVSHTAGSDSVALTVTPEIASWTATANAPWLHLSAANSSGTGSTNITFTFDANPGTTRVGTLTIAGQTLTVTQAALPVPEISVQQPAGINLTDGSATNGFGNGYVGFTNTINTFVITNSGTTNLTGLAIAKDGANAGDFIVSTIGSPTLAPNASTTFMVSFAPTASGDRTAAIHITSNDADENPFDIALTGFAIAPSNSLSATAHFVGYLGGNSNVTLTVTPEIATWTATANAAWLQLSPPNSGGTGSTNITYTFNSNPGSQRVGTLTIGGQTLTVTQAALPLQEISIQQPAGTELVDNASTRDFGLGIVNITNQTKTFTITNSGTTNLTGIAITKNGVNAGDFIVSSAGSTNLPANSSTTFTVSFAPASAGNRTAAIQIASNDSDENPFDIALTGKGVIPSFFLATSDRIVGPAAGADSIVLAVTPNIATWTATANSPWLHLNATNQTGTGNATVIFTFDANPGATRTGTLTIAGQLLTVTQAGASYVAAGNVTTNINPSFGEVRGMEADASGNIYFTDGWGYFLSRWNSSNNTVTPLVSNGLITPTGLASDTVGNIYIADRGNGAIKKWWLTNGAVTTVVSSGLNAPEGLAVAANGDIFIADSLNSAIKKWSVASNTLTTVVSGLSTPMAVALDAAENLYIADWSTNQITKWNVADNSLTVLVTGGSQPVWAVEVDEGGNVYYGEFVTGDVRVWKPTTGTDSSLLDLPLESPTMTIDKSGYIYASEGPQRDRIITLPRALVDPSPKSVGFAAGSGVLPVVLPNTANLRGPFTPISDQPWLVIGGVTNGVIGFNFTANTTPTNRVATISVLGQAISVTQAGAPFNSALGTTNLVVSPASGTDSVVLFIQPVTSSNWTATANSHWLHLSAPNQAGNSSMNVIFTFDANTGATRIGTLTIAEQTLFVTQGGTNVLSAGSLTTLAASGFNQPKGLTADSAGNLYIADTGNNAVKKWTRTNNTVTTLISGLNQPGGVAVDAAGNVFIADSQNFAIKKWTASNSVVSTVISSGLNRPAGVAVDTAGNLYIADTYNNAIKKWTATNNTVTTLVNSGLDLPNGLAVDAAGNVYIADTFFNRIKKWTAANQTVTTVISTGLIQPHGVAVDASGNIYVADSFNHAIKKWTVTSGAVTTLLSGLNLPKGVATDESGNVYIADTSNNQIKQLPRVFVDTSPRTINTSASTNSLLLVFPASVNLLPPFAPTSSQAWLTINSVSNSVINFSVTANTGGSRAANLTVLNRSIPITQTLIVTPPLIGYSKVLGGLALNFTANPGQLYQIESAPAVTGPWTTNIALTAGESGLVSYTNPISTTGNRFFRTRTP